MRATRNTIRLHRTADRRSVWEDVREWAKRSLTNEKVAEVSLALVAAMSICYLGFRLYTGLQNYALYAY